MCLLLPSVIENWKKKYWKLKNLMMSKILWFLSFFCMCISGCITIFLCLPKYFQDDEFDPSPNKKKQKVPLIFIYRMYKVSKKEVSISLFSLLSKNLFFGFLKRIVLPYLISTYFKWDQEIFLMILSLSTTTASNSYNKLLT